MLFNTSYKNKDYEEECQSQLGKPYSFLDKVKMNGVGSSRLIIVELHDELAPSYVQETDIKYASIELRPKGIIIHFSNRLERYSWIIPFFKLVIFSSETFSIHSNGQFIKFRKDKNYIQNSKFIKKMINLKNTFLNPDG